MKKFCLGIAAGLMLFVSACYFPAPYYYGSNDTYYYYPEDEVYYYPRVREYYWSEGGEWRHAARAPERYALRDPVRIESEGEPTRYHDRIRRDFPPRRELDRGREQQREKPRA